MSGESYLSETNWDVYKANMGYAFNEGMYRDIRIITTFYDYYLKLDCFKNFDRDYIIFEFDDFKW